MAGNSVDSKGGENAVEIETPIIPVTSIEVSPRTDQDKQLNDTFTITATVKPENATYKTINWSTSDSNVVTLSATTTNSGASVTITCKAEGETTVTLSSASNSKQSVSFKIKVRDGGVIKHIKTPEGLKEVNTKDVYGADVKGYICDRKKDNGTELEWQIFYIDEEDDHRVYLISKNYMSPPTTGTELTKGYYSHCYYWTDAVLSKFKTIIPNTKFT